MRKWLRDARQKKGYTMKEAAQQLDISESYYSLIENGERQKKMDVMLVMKLSSVFGIPIKEIVAFENN